MLQLMIPKFYDKFHILCISVQVEMDVATTLLKLLSRKGVVLLTHLTTSQFATSQKSNFILKLDTEWLTIHAESQGGPSSQELF